MFGKNISKSQYRFNILMLEKNVEITVIIEAYYRLIIDRHLQKEP